MFSGSQSAILPIQVEKNLRSYIKNNFGALEENHDILLTYLIQGSYYLYNMHCNNYDIEKLINLVGVASDGATEAVKNKLQNFLNLTRN